MVYVCPAIDEQEQLQEQMSAGQSDSLVLVSSVQLQAHGITELSVSWQEPRNRIYSFFM